MTTQLQKANKIVATTEDTIDAYVMTKDGTMIVGQQFVSDKWLALLCEAIQVYKSSESTPAAVVIRNDNYPKAAFGMCYADTYSIALNLQRMWDEAVSVMESGDKFMSLSCLLQINWISTVAHELDHMDFVFKDRDFYEEMRGTKEGSKDLEDSARGNESKMIEQLARDFDTEIPKASALGWFGIKMMELFTNADTKDLDWVVRARKMEESGTIYHDTDNGLEHTSFRDYVARAYEREGTPGWEQPVNHVNLEAHLEDGTVELSKAELLPEPKLEVKEPEPEEVAMTQDANNVFVQVSDDDGAGMVVDSDEPAETAEVLTPDNFTGDATAVPGADAAASFVPPPVPDTPVVAEQKAAFAAAAETAVPQPQETPTTYEPHNIPAENVQNCMKAVYQMLYHHTFTKCGWQQDPATGRHTFTQAAAILTGVDVSAVIAHFGCEGLIKSYDTVDADGKYGGEDFHGMIRGHVTSKAGLPRYVLYLNMGGHRFQRAFVPQNPEKKNAQNAYGKNAAAAGQGNHIAYVYKGEAPDHAAFNEKCAVVINNNDYQVMS